MKETSLSGEYLKAITGKFDLETIFNLELTNKNIRNLGAIPQCTSLIFLDLSHNKLTEVSQIGKCVELVFLDVSFNQINSLSGIESLKELKNLKVHGNNIGGPVPTLLGKMKKLEKITFQIMPYADKPEINTSNPICKISDYRDKILDNLPFVKWLDGVPRSMEPLKELADDPTENNMEKLNPKNFDFNFADKIKLDPEEIVPNEELEKTRKFISEKYEEFENNLNELREHLKEIG